MINIQKPDFSSDEEDDEDLSTQKKKRKPSVVDDDSKDENSEDEGEEEDDDDDDDDESMPSEVPVSRKKREFEKKKQFIKIKPSKISKTTASNKESKSKLKEFDDEKFIIRKMRGGVKSRRNDK